jgi:fructokinase
MREANLPMIGLADVLKVNDEEARILTGSADLQKALDVMAQSHRLVVITLGPDGCLWRWKGEPGRVESPRVDVVETTGAGDAFVGALLADLVARGYGAGHLEELPVAVLQEILRFAGAAGAMACTAPGAMASLPTRGEVEALLSGASSA